MINHEGHEVTRRGLLRCARNDNQRNLRNQRLKIILCVLCVLCVICGSCLGEVTSSTVQNFTTNIDGFNYELDFIKISSLSATAPVVYDGAGVFSLDYDINDFWLNGTTLEINDVNIHHGSLYGLAADDHTQYLLADGTRGLSGNWNAGVFGITANSFTIGADTLATSEWAYLDGQDQAVKSTSIPTFDGLTSTAPLVDNYDTVNGSDWLTCKDNGTTSFRILHYGTTHVKLLATDNLYFECDTVVFNPANGIFSVQAGTNGIFESYGRPCIVRSRAGAYALILKTNDITAITIDGTSQNVAVSNYLRVGSAVAPTVPLDVTGAILGSTTIEAGTGFKCGGTAAVADGTYNFDGTAAGTVSTMTFKGGICTGITTR